MREKAPGLRLIIGGANQPLDNGMSDAARRVVDGNTGIDQPKRSKYDAEALKQLGESMLVKQMEIDKIYDPISKDDLPLYKLEIGLQTVQGLANFEQDLGEFVLYNTRHFREIGGRQYKRNQSMRVADGLYSLEMAQLLALGDGSVAEGLKDFRHYVDKFCPSRAWEDPQVAKLLFELIADSHEIIKIIVSKSDQPKVIERLREGFLGAGGVGLTEISGRQIENARILAWHDWPDLDDDLAG